MTFSGMDGSDWVGEWIGEPVCEFTACGDELMEDFDGLRFSASSATASSPAPAPSRGGGDWAAAAPSSSLTSSFSAMAGPPSPPGARAAGGVGGKGSRRSRESGARIEGREMRERGVMRCGLIMRCLYNIFG